MNTQCCLFDAQERAAEGVGPYTADEKRDLDIALGAPPDLLPPKPPKSWRSPMRGMRFLKLGLENGTSIVVETTLSVSELSNELRSKTKAALTLADGRSFEVRHQDVIYLENVYRVPV